MNIEAMRQAMYTVYAYISAFENHKITNAKSSNLDMTGYIAELARNAIKQAEEQDESMALMNAEILKAVKAEREACAKIAENRLLTEASDIEKIAHYTACKNIASEIRARGRA